jgi:hypothetical protein
MKRSFPILSYLVYIALAIWMILSLQEGINALPEEGGSISEDIGIGLTEGFSKVFMLLFAAYGGVSVLAILVKIAHVGTHLCFFGLLSALFDLAFTLLHGAVLFYVIDGGSLTVPIIPLSALAFISLISFFVNTMSISN